MAEITGGCICGALTYTAKGDPVRMGQCHCKHCQRASGTGHMSLAFFKKEDVSINGDFTEYAAEADSGNHNIRAFCPTCGSRVFGRNSANDAVVAITEAVPTTTIGSTRSSLFITKINPAGTIWMQTCRRSMQCHHQSLRSNQTCCFATSNLTEYEFDLNLSSHRRSLQLAEFATAGIRRLTCRGKLLPKSRR